MILIIGFIVICLACFISFLLSKGPNLNNRKAILYMLFFALIIGAFGLFGLVPHFAGSFIYFILLQMAFLGLGYLMSYLLKKNFWGEFKNEKLTKVLFVIANVTLGMICFTIVFDWLDKSAPDMGGYFSLSAITFVLPQFLVTSFQAYTEIPIEIYKEWYFPANAEDIDFDRIDTSVIYMLELEYTKSVTDDRISNSKLRAPLPMNFGEWFRYFLENYNYKHEQDPIYYTDNAHMPYGWIFYEKPTFFRGARHIDPELSISANKLSEKRKIIARRVAVE